MTHGHELRMGMLEGSRVLSRGVQMGKYWDNCNNKSIKYIKRKVMDLTNKDICIIHRHRQQCVDGQREVGVRAGWRWTKQREIGTSVMMSEIKIK